MGEWVEVAQGPALGNRLEIGDELTLGRLEAGPADLAGDRELSRRHARFWRAAGGELLVEDLGSANGTLVNGTRIDRPHLLAAGDTVSLGGTTLVVRSDHPTRIRPAAQTGVPGAPQGEHESTAGPTPAAPERPRTARLLVPLVVLLILALAGLAVALATRDGGTTQHVLANSTVVSPIFPVTGLKFSGMLATFKQKASNTSAAATIDWGDGTPPVPGTIGAATPDGSGTFTRSISASHTYARAATFAVTAAVTAAGDDTQRASNLAVVTNCFCVTKLPKVSRSVDLGPVSGRVLVRPLGAPSFVPLTAPREVPVGSELDTTNGSLVVQAGTATAGKLVAGAFDGGLFQLLQPQASGGLVELALRGASAATCPSAQPSHPSSGTTSSQALALLHASVNGSFQTRGRFSAGTVRGTEWTTQEQCDGTLTRVQRGTVDVKNLRTGATVEVRPGQSYLAKSR